jgi:hypothetical protein
LSSKPGVNLKGSKTTGSPITKCIKKLNIQLYDLAKDPSEASNIASKYPEKVATLSDAD